MTTMWLLRLRARSFQCPKHEQALSIRLKLLSCLQSIAVARLAVANVRLTEVLFCALAVLDE
jgi:hypothetical protein